MKSMRENQKTLCDYSLNIKEVTSMFGHFIKYRVKAAAQVQEEVLQSVSRSAFDVLMSVQRQLQSVCHPPEI